MPKAIIGQMVGKVLLRREVLGIVVGIEITVMIPQIGHEFGGRIAQRQRDR